VHKKISKNAAAATLMIRTVGVNASVALEARPLGEEHAQLALLDWFSLVRELALLALRLGRVCAGMVSRLPCLPTVIAEAAAGAHWLHEQPSAMAIGPQAVRPNQPQANSEYSNPSVFAPFGSFR
jgi:hypothetical protein